MNSDTSENIKESTRKNMSRWLIRSGLILSAILLFTATQSNAIDPFAGIESVDLEIGGKHYLVPVVPEAGKGYAMSKNDAYYFKKMIRGDEEAREVLMGNLDEKWFFIGRETPVWLKITKYTEEVFEL